MRTAVVLVAVSLLASSSLATLPKVITASVRLQPGIYRLPSSDLTKPSLEIRGDNITVDARGVVLQGSSDQTRPDQRQGLGIRVTGRNVSIRGLSAHGYKVGLMATGARGLKILEGDFSYNWKQELKSGREREDISDWMSFHKNEDNEWLRFGAGIYLDDCDGAQVKRTTIVGGQCGLMMTETDSALVIDNNFSFLSAVGLGMYRSSDNSILHNKIDWCVRGYSHGIYNRGQDSTGILIYEQSHRNKFGFNSVTHGGDGFFLWAGQTTMDTGKGGCNDNILYGNDFSHAPTNGIEATFSRNAFVNNLIMECWHGVWGGYSYETIIDRNIFAYNGEAIAIEHGQDNQILRNLFYRDANSIRLWMNASQDPNWGYPKFRDTASRDYLIKANTFHSLADEAGGLALRLDATKGVILQRNAVTDTPRLMQARQTEIPEMSWLGSAMTVGEVDGMVVATSTSANRVAPVMRTSGTVVLPYPEGLAGYQRQFRHTWNPLDPDQSWIDLGAQKFDLEPIAGPRLKPVPGAQNPFLPTGALRGRRYIMIDEWGPYDFRRPILWLREKREENGVMKATFDLMGPQGQFKVVGTRGMKVERQSGSVPSQLKAEWVGDEPGRAITLEFVGQKVVDSWGRTWEAGKRVPFGWRDDSIPLSWTLDYWNYDLATHDPRKVGHEFEQMLGASLANQKVSGELNQMWWRSPAQGIKPDNFATRATTTLKVPTGEYILEITADDGVRVWLDGEKLLDEWKYSGPTTYTITRKLGGNHRLEIRHFELDGFAQLTVKVRRRS